MPKLKTTAPFLKSANPMGNSVQLWSGRQVIHQEGYQQALNDFGISELLENQITALPTDFSTPKFGYGDYLRWKPLSVSVETDFGTVIGRFYLPAPHRRHQWVWKYLILLDRDSPSSAIVAADTAWEDQLESRKKEST